MTFRKIGILGGMGPQATILLQERLLNAIPARDDADHIPLLIDMNPQIPSRIKWLLENGTIDPAPALVEMAKRLETAGAQVLAMPCNTAHAFAEDIENAVKVPFLNMPRLAVSHIARKVAKGGAVGILASPATEKTKLFIDELCRRGLTAIYPVDQGPLLNAIKRIKAIGPNPEALETLRNAARELEQRGVRAIIVGCSEFSLLSGQIPTQVPLVDTLDVLIENLLVFTKKSTSNEACPALL
jgi:aspartate racemase